MTIKASGDCCAKIELLGHNDWMNVTNRENVWSKLINKLYLMWIIHVYLIVHPLHLFHHETWPAFYCEVILTSCAVLLFQWCSDSANIIKILSVSSSELFVCYQVTGQHDYQKATCLDVSYPWREQKQAKKLLLHHVALFHCFIAPTAGGALLNLLFYWPSKVIICQCGIK